MTEILKYIVIEINKLLKTDYNLISFDSLSVENLLQVLIGVLHKFGASNKYTVKENDPAETNRLILESLKKIQYRPTAPLGTGGGGSGNNINDGNGDVIIDPMAFRRNLLQGDRKTIYPIFNFIFKNTDKIQNLIYLAQFLIPINLPPEAMANPEIATLWNDYLTVMNGFKEIHKAHDESRKENDKFKEIRNDIVIIESERENVKKRIERTQSRLDKIPQQELLLEAAHALRVERERQKELQSQLEDQKDGAQKAALIQERLVKELNSAQASAHDTSPQYLLDLLLEETQVLKFMVEQKLPQELKAKQSELQIYEEIINEPNISREYLKDLQDKVDKVSMDVQKLIEHQLNLRSAGGANDNLIPFRQQASQLMRNKEMAAEQLEQYSKELQDVEMEIHQKQEQLQEIVGGTILRGDDYKQYVNMLRAKNSIYKQQRAELAALKAESNDLQQTLDNLKQQDPSLNFDSTSVDVDAENKISIGASSNPFDDDSSINQIESMGITELGRLVDGLTTAVVSARERATPLAQQLGPLRLKLVDLKEERDSKQQTFNALNATLTAESAVMQSNVTEIQNDIKKLEMKWKDLQQEHNRTEELLKKVDEEQEFIDNGGGGGNDDDGRRRRITLKESLTTQINEQEQLFESLQKQIDNNRNNRHQNEQQIQMWHDLITLLTCKIQCIRDAKHAGTGGTLFVQKGTETFTLQ